MNEDPKNKDDQKPQMPKFRKPNFLLYGIILLTIIGIFIFTNSMMNGSGATKMTLNEFEEYFTAEKITSMNSIPVANNLYHYKVSGTYVTANGTVKKYTLYMLEDTLNEYVKLCQTEYKDICKYETGIVKSNDALNIIINLLPYALLLIGVIIVFKMSAGANNKSFEFGKNRAKLMREKTKTFADVAGCDEEKEELVEVVDFLKNPKKYSRLGARIPKGVLLVGPPGTGKTLLAKAVAGEASVPFFSISGSDFVEMFVGVGASRVRDLFKVAKENAPCIIFIDEIDAVGRQRGAGMGGGHDEREQTLNQLLVEMDGFSNNSGIIMIAATNRPDVLDPALLRPGRFDRQITINTPDIKGREAILNVHARGKQFENNIDFSDIAQRIPGFSGADIENLLNEAALLVARDNRDKISLQDIDEAIDRVMMGPAKKSKKYTEKERKMVAYHEAGHAVIGLRLENASTVQKITIIPRGQAGGYNLMMPKEETFTRSKRDLLDSITGYLGGRAAEEIMFEEISTGAYGDIKQATRIARAMVAEYGMSDLGPILYEESGGSVFLGRDYLKEKNFSDAVASEIDTEVRKIIFNCHKDATRVIKENIDLLHNIASYLLKVETLNKQDIEEIDKTGKLKWYDEKEERKLQTKQEQTSYDTTSDGNKE